MKNDTSMIFGEFSGSHGWKNFIKSGNGYCVISTMLIKGNMDEIADNIVADKPDDSIWETMIFECDKNGNVSEKSWGNPLRAQTHHGYVVARNGHRDIVLETLT